MSEHVLKIHPKPFHDLQSGAKTGEVRSCADRDFNVGDGVLLMMIDETGNPTGIEMQRKITHIQTGYGLPDDICVLSYAQYTAVDMTTASADGFRDGRKSVGLLLGKGFNTLEQSGGKYSINLAFQNADDAYAAYTEIATVVGLGVEP